MIQPGKQLICSDYQHYFLVLRGNGILDILLVVHTKTVELAQDLHSLRHIPFSSSRDSFYKNRKNVLAKPEIDQEIVVVQQEVFCKKLLRLWILVDQNLEFRQYGFPE